MAFHQRISFAGRSRFDPTGGALESPLYDYFYDDYGNQVGILDKIKLSDDWQTLDYSASRLTVFKYDHLHRQVEKFMPFEVTVDPCDVIDAAWVYSELEDEIDRTIDDDPTDVIDDLVSEARAYDSENRLDTNTDYKGQVTEFVYDGRGRLQFKKYYHAGDVPGTDDPAEGYEYTYDDLGRTTQVDYLVDSSGNLVLSYTDQAFTYDTEGRVIQIVSHDDPLVDDDEGILHYDYDEATGRKVSSWTGINIAHKVSRTDYRYDDLGRLAEVEVVRRDNDDVSGEITSYTYDKNGNRLTMDLPNDIDTTYTYDALNRLTNVNHEVSETTKSSFAYTLAADGQRVSVREQIEDVVGTGYDYHEKTYTPDALNRLTLEKVVETDGNWENPTTQYEVRYKFDLAGNRVKRQVDAGGTKQTTSYSYDAATDRLEEEYTEVNWVKAHQNEYPVYLADNDGDKDGQRLVWMKMPSKWWGVGLWVALGVMLTLLLLPQVLPNAGKKRLRVWYRGTTWLMVAVFILGPFSLEVMATTNTQYEQLSSRMAQVWSDTGSTIDYTYDKNGSLTQKDVTNSSDDHTVDYAYNLQGRLAIVTTTRVDDLDYPTPDGDYDDHLIEEVLYFYNSDGIRVGKEYRLFHDIDEETNPTANVRVQQGNTTTTDYLIDPANHTGYAQTVIEVTDNGSQVDRVSYTVGDDVIDETLSTDIGAGGTPSLGDPDYLIYDGQGSVRHRVAYGGSGDLNEYTSQSIDFNTEQYDAYGNSLIPQVGDTLGYAGEHWDNNAKHYYNRARWYNPANGRFNRVDPFAGNNADPQSLHKYLYAHNNPVNNIDPSGNMSLVMKAITVGAIAGLLMAAWSAIDTALNPNSDWGDIIFSAGVGFLIGFSVGALMTVFGPTFVAKISPYIPYLVVLVGGKAAYDSFSEGLYAQGIFRIITTVLLLGLSSSAVRQKAVKFARGIWFRFFQSSPAATTTPTIRFGGATPSDGPRAILYNPANKEIFVGSVNANSHTAAYMEAGYATSATVNTGELVGGFGTFQGGRLISIQWLQTSTFSGTTATFEEATAAGTMILHGASP